MQTIRLNLGTRSYPIIIGDGAVNSLPDYLKESSLGTDAYIVTNSLINGRYGRQVSALLKKGGFGVTIKLIPDSERSKSAGTALELIRDIASQSGKKSFFVVALGGGVVGDIAGFVASIYKRGIPYIQIPTTLLAQVDSAIGGKTAVDLPEGKNLVGSFYQPRLVVSDSSFLGSLDPRQIRSGLAEVIKYGMIADRELFTYLESEIDGITSLKPASLEYIVSRCSSIKARVVEKDEREEKGLRTILNFGHTIGHAIETASGYTSYGHGEAVALGMLAAADISVALGLLPETAKERLIRMIFNTGLPVKIKNISLEAVINAHYRDKKFIGGRNRFVLVKDVGRAVIIDDVPLPMIKRAVKKLLIRGHIT